MGKTFYVVDGSSYVYRAFFAIRSLSNSSGLPTNAVYGFTKMLLRIVDEKKPDYLAITFDSKGPTFRHEMYKNYKANRPPMPDLLAQQIPYIHRMVKALRIPIFRENGFEADDLIGTLARKGAKAGLDVVITSGDKDMYQLISPLVTVYDSMKEKVYTEEGIEEIFGIRPDQIIEMMGLMGDSVDNIPGVSGIGKKTAIQLVQSFGTIENLLNRLNEVKRPRLKKMLETEGEIARLSRQLALIKTDCPFNFDLEAYKYRPPDHHLLDPLCHELEFFSLIKNQAPLPDGPTIGIQVLNEKNSAEVISDIVRLGETAIALFESPPEKKPVKLLAFALSYRPGKAVYLPIADGNKLPPALKTLLVSQSLCFYGHELKTFLTALKQQDQVCHGRLFDVTIASYLLNPLRRDYSIEGLSLEYLKEELKVDEENKALSDDASPEAVIASRCKTVEAILRISKKIKEPLRTQSLDKLFDEMEMPLVPVLSDIEQNGVKIDVQSLHEMSKLLEEKLSSLRALIYSLAGCDFNINSPKQLAEILFNRLGLNPIKKTKTGYSTNEEVLKKLSSIHPLPAEILNIRQITKLKSTYTDALPKLVRPETGRIHTQLNQTVTATGRLSSKEPNLQNIPVRGEVGRQIREAFIAEKGNLILSADYNQIELRVLAHLSGDSQLLESFLSGGDVHTQTAIELFGLQEEKITREMRRIAKTVNFGIIYGISPFGLSNNLGVSLKEAKRYIDLYFEHYHGVQRFIDKTLSEATERGYVTTLFNRRRYITELSSRNSFTRGIGERLAINTPVQGSAADIIKLAMIAIWRWMKSEALKSKMTLQVHDELLFDVPEKEVPLMKEKVRDFMEGVVKLKVPLKVDVGVGSNWSEAH